MYTGRENFCTDFKSIAAEAAQGDGTVPKAAKNFWKGAEKRNRISWETEHQELSNIEVTDGNIRSFEKYARKYDIDYCLKKDRSAEPPKYYVFFKAKEVDSITAAFKEYTGWQVKKSKKVSVRKKLYLAMERVAKHRQREKMKQKNRGQEH